MIAALLSEYRRRALEHGAATRQGDYRAANRAFDSLLIVAKELLVHSDGGPLIALFDDPDRWIQLWAATHAIEVDESRAVAKLEQLAAAAIPLVSMSARYVLESWRKGELKPLRK